MRRLLLLGWLAALAPAAPPEGGIAARWDAPRRESFDLKGVRLERVVATLGERYGTPVRFRADDRLVDFRIADATFFEALDALAAGERLYLTGTADALTLVRPGAPLPPTPVAHLGASRLSAESIAVHRVLRFAPEPPAEEEGCFSFLERPEDDEQDRIRLVLRWSVERGFEDAAVLGWELEPAHDDTGAPLLPRAVETDYVPAFPWPANGAIRVDCDPGGPGAKAIKRLAGTLRVALPVEIGEAAFRADELGMTRTLGDSRITLRRADEDPGVGFVLHGGPCRALLGTDGERGREAVHGPEVALRTGERWHVERVRIDDVGLYVYDADGREVGMGQSSHMSGAMGLPRWEHSVGLSARPHRVVFRAVTKIEVREVRFALEGVPLPR